MSGSSKNVGADLLDAALSELLMLTEGVKHHEDGISEQDFVGLEQLVADVRAEFGDAGVRVCTCLFVSLSVDLRLNISVACLLLEPL